MSGSNLWECEAVIVANSPQQKRIVNQICGNGRTAPITIGGKSYDTLQFEPLGLCFCTCSSETGKNARIARLAKIDRYFSYGKLILLNPPYREATCKRLGVEPKNSWYFVRDKDAFCQLMRLNYSDLPQEKKELLDQLITNPPYRPQPRQQSRQAARPGEVILQQENTMIVMRGAPPHPNHPPPRMPMAAFLSMIGAPPSTFTFNNMEGSVIGGQVVRRREEEPSAPVREAQPEVKRAKAISQEDMECICCCENQKDCVLSCGHMQMCMVCASKVETCPDCRQPITSRQKLWL